MTSSPSNAEALAETTSPHTTALPPHLKRIVLTGFMGAGKSTVGRLLAEKLGWNFLDLDAHLEHRAGATIPEIFALHGEPRFRRLESTALASALSHHHTVIALGGGTPESLTNRLLLEQTPGTFTIFLDAPFPTLYDRCMIQALNPEATARPVLADPEAANLRFAARHPLYLRVAGLTLDTADLTPHQTVGNLLNSLKTS